MIYRPYSQIARQRSKDISDLQSKTKKISNKHNQQYAKKIIDNQLNDSSKRLKIENASFNRNQLRQKIQIKLKDQDKQMSRSGIVRYIKPKLPQREYKRFKKLFQLFIKIEKTRYEILSLSCAVIKFSKDGSNLYQTQRIKDLKENLLRLQIEQEKLLLEYDHENKENNFFQVSRQKQTSMLSRRVEIQQNRNLLKRAQNSAEIFNQNNEKNLNIHKNQKSPSLKNAEQNICQKSYLLELFQCLAFLDSKYQKNKIENSQNPNNQSSTQLFKKIKEALQTKQGLINQLYEKISSINLINHKEQIQTKNFQQVSQSVRQFSKFHDIEQRSRFQPIPLDQQQDKAKTNVNSKSSFKSLIEQIEYDLNELKQMNIIKKRNNQLAKKLLITSKELQKCEEQKLNLEKNAQLLKENQDFQLIIKKQNQLVHKKNQKLQQKINQLQEQLAKANTKQAELSTQIQLKVCNLKQSSKFQKYFRETLTLQQEVQILSEQNQKLVKQLKLFKEHREKQVQQSKAEDKLKQTDQCEDNRQQLAIQLTTNQKTIKQSGTSLIYKQFEKKSRKLQQQNIKFQNQILTLTQQLKQLKEKNLLIINENLELNQKLFQEQNNTKSLTELNQTLSEKNSKNRQDIASMKEQIAQIHLQCTSIKQENLKLQEQFEYIVKQKLQLQAQLSIKTKFKSTMSKINKIFTFVNESLFQIKQSVFFVKNQLNQLQNETKYMLLSLYQSLSTAMNIFVNQSIINTCKTQSNQDHLIILADVQHKVHTDNNNDLQNSKNLLSQPKQTQESSAIITLQQIEKNEKMPEKSNSCQEQAQINYEQQIQALVEELNHCINELNFYKTVLNQIQIEKQLQKKYLQQDISKLQSKLLKIQYQNQQFKFQIRQWNTLQHNSIQNKFKAENLKIEIEQNSSMIEIVSNVLSIQIPNFKPADQNKNYHRLTICSDAFNFKHSKVQMQKELKINCESVSIHTLPDSTTKQFVDVSTQFTVASDLKNIFLDSNTISMTINHHCQRNPSLRQEDTQKYLTFNEWIQQITLQTSTETQSFKNFCQFNLYKESNLNQPIQSNAQFSNNENHQLKLQFQRFNNKNCSEATIQFYPLPFENIFPLQDKNQDQNNQKSRNAPTLESQNSLIWSQQIQKEDDNYKYNQSQTYQLFQTKKTLQIISPKSKNQQSLGVNPNNKKVGQTQNNLDEDQSFDLCII